MACLRTVLGAHDVLLTMEELRQRCDVGRDGVSAAVLARVARSFGLTATGARLAGAQGLAAAPPGTILHWEGTHFVVLLRAGKRWVHVLDPGIGRRQMRTVDACRQFSGAALLVEGTATATDPPPRRSGRWMPVREQLPGLRGGIALALVVSLATRLLVLAPVLLAARAIDDRSASSMPWLAVAVAFAAGSYYALARTRAALLIALRTRLDAGMNEALVRRILSLRLDFVLRRSANDLLMRLRSIADIRDAVSAAGVGAAIDLPFLTIYVALLVRFSPTLAAVLITLVAVHAAAVLSRRRALERTTAEYVQAQISTNSYAQQMLAAMPIVAAMGMRAAAAAEYRRRYSAELEKSRTRSLLQSRTEALNQALRVFGPTGMLVLALQLEREGSLSLGEAVATVPLAAGVLEPIAALLGMLMAASQATVALDRIVDLPEPTEATPDAAPAVPASDRLAGLQVTSMSYRHAGARQFLLDGITAEVPRGGTLAITGDSGSGKTTLGLLLVGALTPTAGSVRFRGASVAASPPDVGVVLQDPHLVAGTIRDNVLMGRVFSDDDVRIALRRADAGAFVSLLPLGLDTALSDSGSGLSGGQRQRIAIARALVGRPELLLLDEATSQLDATSARRVLAEVAATGCTAIIVTHDPRVAATAGQILPL